LKQKQEIYMILSTGKMKDILLHPDKQEASEEIYSFLT